MLEVQDIMKKYGEEYRKKHKLMAYKLSAMTAIERCRTAELGAHIVELIIQQLSVVVIWRISVVALQVFEYK